MNSMSEAIVVIAVLLYNLAILVGATYLVVVYDWSLWTYFFAIFFTLSIAKRKKDE
jgi:hypothetical protein